MAVDKHITMRQYNGLDYDTLYPKTIINQVDGLDTTINGINTTIAGIEDTIKDLEGSTGVKVYTATIGTTWTADETTGVQTQIVSITGVTAENTAIIDCAYTGSGTSEDNASFTEALKQYLNYITNGYAKTVAGGIQFTIFGDPNTVNIPIVLEVT